MFQIQTLNKISKVGTCRLDAAKYTIADAPENPDAIMVRSAAMHDMEFGSNLLAIARAGAGVNNIPVDKCAEQGIVVFNTPGANANGVFFSAFFDASDTSNEAGVEFNKKYQVALSYDFGLIDVQKDLGMKNRNLMISLGYMF